MYYKDFITKSLIRSRTSTLNFCKNLLNTLLAYVINEVELPLLKQRLFNRIEHTFLRNKKTLILTIPQVNDWCSQFTMGMLIKKVSTFLSTNNFSFFASLVTSKARKIIDTCILKKFA